MTLQLRPYQQDIVDHIIANKRTNLFVPMGSGKTSSVLTAITKLAETEEIFPVLVVAPLRVARTTWPDEIEKWPHLRHLRVSVISGNMHQRDKALDAEADIYTINYDNLVYLKETLGKRWPFKMIVADECTKLKGFRLRQGTKRAQALAYYAHATPRYVGLTGTPAANGLQDLWALNWFIDKGERLGNSFGAFTDRWFQTTATSAGFMLIRPLPTAQREIEDRIKDTSLSIDLREHIDIRQPVVNNISVVLPEAAHRIYRDMERQMFTELASETNIAAFSAAPCGVRI